MAKKQLCVEDVVSSLQACKRERNVGAARAVQKQIRENGLESDRAIGNHLVPAFIECGSLLEAQNAFDKLLYPNVCSWTYLIQGYVHAGHFHHALHLFWEMMQQQQQQQHIHLLPNRFTILAVLKACTKLNCLVRGRQVHSEVVYHGLEDDEFIGNSLVDMYAKYGSLGEAHKVLDCLPVRDVISWTALISGYAEHGFPKDALRCLELMKARGVEPNAITYLYSLKACAALRAIDRGRKIHAEIVEDGFESDELSGSTLMDLYAKCGLTEEAHEVLQELPVQNAVLWTTLIAGYAEQGLGEDALACLEQMQLSGVTPDEVTFICSLKACGTLGLVDKGQELHAEMIKEEHENNALIGSTVVDMYGKCGLLLEMREIFEELALRDVVTWTALIAGYASQGKSELVFYHFEQMCKEGIEPNETTFLVLFTTCNHAGLVWRGVELYERMIREHAMAPTIKHLNCMVDLVGRAGQLDEASGMLQQMPVQPNVVTWETILGSCRKWGNVALARHAFESAVRLDEQHHGVLVLMSNIYADEDYDH